MTTMATDEKDAPKAKSSETWYSMDEAKIEEVRQAKAWMQDANYFTRVMVSPAASMKMLMHAHSGCEAGLSAGGKPLEVMGMMLGYPSDEHKHTLVVTDVFPLPVTGFETQVVADDENVINRAGKESEIPDFKGSDLGHFPLVSADFWTSDHLSERSRSMDAFSGTRARGTLTLKRR